jgi:hypothetical protein
MKGGILPVLPLRKEDIIALPCSFFTFLTFYRYLTLTIIKQGMGSAQPGSLIIHFVPRSFRQVHEIHFLSLTLLLYFLLSTRRRKVGKSCEDYILFSLMERDREHGNAMNGSNLSFSGLLYVNCIYYYLFMIFLSLISHLLFCTFVPLINKLFYFL